MATVTIYSDASDGGIDSGDASYALARAGTGSTLTANDVSAQNTLGQYLTGGVYHSFELFLQFDTSALGVAPITTILSLDGNSDSSTQDFTAEARLSDWGATLTSADFIPGASLGSLTLLATWDSAGYSAGYNDFTESSGALTANLNLAGFTRMVLASDRARLNNTPVGAEFCSLKLSEETGTTSDPKLVITYAGASTDDILNPAVDVAVNSWTTDTGGTTDLYAAIDETLTELLTTNQRGIETDITGWTAGTSTSITRSTSQARTGAASLAITRLSTTGTGRADTPTGTSGFPVSPSTSYTLLGSVRAAATPRLYQFTVWWYQSNGSASAILNGLTWGTGTDSTSAWSDETFVVTSPSDAAFGSISFESLSNVANEVHYIDDLSAFSTVDTDYIQSPAGPTTAQYYETALETHADPSSSSGHVVHYRYKKNVAGGNVALTVALVQGTPPPELLTVNQQELETDTTGWGGPSNCTIARSTAQAHLGAASLALTSTVASGTMFTGTPTGLLGIPVSDQSTFGASCWVRAATVARTVTLAFYYYNSSGGYNGAGSVAATSTTTGWTQIIYSDQPTPAGTAFVGISVASVVGGIGEVVYFDTISLTQGSIGSWTHANIPSSWTQQDKTLTTIAADSITDYSDLRLHFTPDMITSDQTTPVPTFVASRATANSNTATTTVDLVLTGLTVGNYLIIRSAADNPGGGGAAVSFTPSNLSGSAMGTHTEHQQNNDPGAAGAGTTCNVSVIKIAATSGTIRLTYGGSVVQSCAAEEWSGIDPTTPVVGTPIKANGTASTNFVAGTALTDASVALGNVAYAAISVEGPTSDTYTQDADTTNGSWVTLTKLGTSIATADLNQTTYGAYKTVTATGAQTYNPTGSVARDSAGIILELAAAPTPAATIKAQVSWANFELPAGGVALTRFFGANVGAAAFPTTGAVSFGAGDA